MANTQPPTFFRQFEVFAPIKKTKNISEPVRVSLGFTGEVEPESGMILNLIDIDAWIEKFRESTTKKIYQSRWDFIRFVTVKFKKMIPLSEFTAIRFHFHDLHVLSENKSLHIAWTRLSQVRSGKDYWISEATLKMKVTSKAWPPISSVNEAAIRKNLTKFHLEKMKWSKPGLIFSSLQYFDPRLNIHIILK